MSVRLSVRPSVTFVDHVKMNKPILEFFSPSGIHTILVFPHQTGWRYSDGNPPNEGVECRWGIGRNRDSGLIMAIEDCWTCEVPKTFTDDEAEHDTVGHAPLATSDHWLRMTTSYKRILDAGM